MQKKVRQIRDIAVIEKELNACPVGILAVYTEKEKIIQLASTYLYQDKNIYINLDETSELYQSIHFEMHSSFAVVKNEKKKNSRNENPSYNSLSVIISGTIKKIDDQKLIEEIKLKYLQKYSFSEETAFSANSRVVIIDTEEIQAVEESGG